MKRQLLVAAATALVLVTGAASAHDRRVKNNLVAELKPSQEVPAISSPTAKGSFTATIDEANQTIAYELSYEGLEGTAVQGHIHLGQRGVNGGVSVFLCGSATTPVCAASPATITGVITPASIIGPNGQGIAPSTATANEFAELVAALRDGLTYANVHSTKFPGGEVRGQLRARFSHGDNDD